MKKNVGSIDKVVRILMALVVIVLFFTHNFRCIGSYFADRIRNSYSYQLFWFLPYVLGPWHELRQKKGIMHEEECNNRFALFCLFGIYTE